MDGWQLAGRTARWAATYDKWYQEHKRTARAAAELERHTRLPDVPVTLNGKAIMELLGIPPGPLIGAATRHLQDLHLERGPLSREEAVALLRTWAVEQDTGRRGRGPVARPRPSHRAEPLLYGPPASSLRIRMHVLTQP